MNACSYQSNELKLLLSLFMSSSITKTITRRETNKQTPNNRIRVFRRRRRSHLLATNEEMDNNSNNNKNNSNNATINDADDVLILYTKPGCCLCEGLEEKIKEVIKVVNNNNNNDNNRNEEEERSLLIGYQLEVRDVSLNSSWADAHAGEIPVLFVGKRGDEDDSETASKVKRPTPRVSIERLKADLENHIRLKTTTTSNSSSSSSRNERGWTVISTEPF